LPDNALVGCLSVPPETIGLLPGQACLGSPAIILPARQQSTRYDARLLFRPGKWQIAQRLLIEGARILLPRSAVFAAICLALDAFEPISGWIGFGPALLSVPLLFIVLFGIPGLFGVVGIKWALVGRYRPAEYPMWSRPVWLSEAVTAVYEGLSVPLVMRHLKGTPFLPMALRLFGAKIGRRVWIDTTDMTEFDLVTIGDEAELNQDGGPQTHLFEDRVMKMDHLRLGARSTMGAFSIALPGAQLADGARLGSLSLVMKGETIPAGQPWAGSPARCQG
jgi:non-ribosomal peptide synthetase-like protein